MEVLLCRSSLTQTFPVVQVVTPSAACGKFLQIPWTERPFHQSQADPTVCPASRCGADSAVYYHHILLALNAALREDPQAQCGSDRWPRGWLTLLLLRWSAVEEVGPEAF